MYNIYVFKNGHEVYGVDIDEKGKLIEDAHDKFFIKLILVIKRVGRLYKSGIY